MESSYDKLTLNTRRLVLRFWNDPELKPTIRISGLDTRKPTNLNELYNFWGVDFRNIQPELCRRK